MFALNQLVDSNLSSFHSFFNQGTRDSGKPKWWQIVLADAVGAGLGILAGGGTAVPLAAGFSAAVTTID